MKLALNPHGALYTGPDKKLKLSLNYPACVGRNMDEITRVVDALQLSAKYSVVRASDLVLICPYSCGKVSRRQFYSREAVVVFASSSVTESKTGIRSESTGKKPRDLVGCQESRILLAKQRAYLTNQIPLLRHGRAQLRAVHSCSVD